jgi:HlyD family secretion protein
MGQVQRRPLELTGDEAGKTRIRDKYVVSAPVTGSLSRIALVAGDAVAEGEHVAELAPVAPQLLDARTRLEVAARVEVAEANLARTRSVIARAESAFELARSQAERSRQLHSQGGVSEQQLERAEYELQAATDELASARSARRASEHELAGARAALSSISTKDGRKITLVAPLTGRVLQVFQPSAGPVQAGTPLLELGDPSALEVVADVLSTMQCGSCRARARASSAGAETTRCMHACGASNPPRSPRAAPWASKSNACP